MKIHTIDDVNNLPDPNDVPERSIIIFDDILTENEHKIAEFFLRGRHRKISCFYLTQSYTKIPTKTAIRDNFNYLILLGQDVTNLRVIYKEYAYKVFKKFEEFIQKCVQCWKKKYGVLAIDAEKRRYLVPY